MKLELCAASLEAIQIAKELNFDRIEICQNLEQGGITPSFGMIEYAMAFGIETHVLIRPRPGGFIYNEQEVEVIIRDVLACKSIGAHGIVFGALNNNNEIDKETMKEIVSKCEGMQVTFHRAFDDCIEWKKTIDLLVELGVNRILTSGLARNVDKGYELLKSMSAYCQEKIELMTGGGVNASNILKLATEIKPAAIHFSGTVNKFIDEDSMFSEECLQIDKERVIRMLKALNL
ncbi:MAG: copper homeostasis protein CutC [Flavobacteriia bacterium]|nr:copper homeostasis protein CutC [Flavobacteriia bacterium]